MIKKREQNREYIATDHFFASADVYPDSMG